MLAFASCHIHMYHECGILKSQIKYFSGNLLYKYDKKVTFVPKQFAKSGSLVRQMQDSVTFYKLQEVQILFLSRFPRHVILQAKINMYGPGEGHELQMVQVHFSTLRKP